MEISERLDALEKLVASHTQEINALKAALGLRPDKPAPALVKPVQSPAPITSEDEFEALKTLLESDQWPAAVEPYLICNVSSEQDKEDRAEGILDLIIDVHLEKLGFLDFGCGEGHVVNRSLMQNPRKAVGYDIAASTTWGRWQPDERAAYTTDWEEVKKYAPYNVVLLYDVLDHIEGADEVVVDNLKKIKEVMAPNARVFVRCHPWCSRHGTHLYHTINKAFIHIVFTGEELAKLGYDKGMWARRIIHPLMTYNNWFQKAGYRLQRKEQSIKMDVEKFFHATPIIAKRIKTHWRDSVEKDLREGKQFPLFQLEFQFVDFVLI
jgi:2-polyprenyl-3-methyl-5-hydroxy-6-metoxy-1,4-benzoquinol methylase